MTVSTPLVARPIVLAPPVMRHTASPEISHPLGVLRRGQANGTSASSSTPLPSHPMAISSRFHDVAHEPHPRIAPRSVRSHTPLAPSPTRPISPSTLHISSTPHVARPVAPTPPVARPVAPMDVSHPHVTSRPEEANGSSNWSSTPLLSHPTAISSRFPGASHEPHPPIAPCSVRSRASSTLSPTLHTLPSNLDDSPSTSAPRKKRSRRCFVCGGTGKHRLNPRFCPRTYELLSKHLATFDATFRLVSYDGSPLPMTRHPGGVAAHLLSPRRFLPRTARASPRSPSTLPSTSKSNPPHVPRVPRESIAHLRPSAAPIANLNRLRAPYSPVEAPHRIPSPDRCTSKLNPPHAPPAVVEHPRRVWFELNPPHLAREERSSSPTFRILTPVRESLPRPETPSKSTRYPDNAFILLLLDCLTLSPSWRRELAGLIDAINRLNLDDDIPRLQKLMEPVRERYKTFVPFI